MPQPSKIPLAFAASGDKNTIPEITETTGFASWRDGFPAITSTPFSEGGIAPKRADFNGIFNALSLATVWQQQGGFYEYDATTDYEVGNVVEDGGTLYKCAVANGPSSSVKTPSADTSNTYWQPITTTTNGALDLSPNSSTVNNGGAVRFHYNNSQSATSQILEDVSGRVRVNGNLYIPSSNELRYDGALNCAGYTNTDFKLNYQTAAYMPKGVSNNYREYTAFKVDTLTGHENPMRVGNVRMWEISSQEHAMDIYSQITDSNNVNHASSIHLYVNENGLHHETLDANPATTDNSVQIATTAFVNSFYDTYIDKLLVRHIQMSNNTSYKFKMRGSIAVVFVMRGGGSKLWVLDTWDSAPNLLAQTETLNVTCALQYGDVVITNNNGNAVVALAFTGRDNTSHWPY